MSHPLSPLLLLLPALLLSVLLSGPVSCQDVCPCTISDSSLYDNTLVMDCASHNLTVFPAACIDDRKNDISELLLSNNGFTELRSTALADFQNIRILMLDHNDLSFVDPSSFDFMTQLQVISFDNNLHLSLEKETLLHQQQLSVLSTIGSNLGQVPDISGSPALVRLDIRSSGLTGLPLQLLNKQMNSSSFYMNCNGNEMMPDVAAMTLLDVPDNSTVNMDTNVIVWARTEEERQTIIAKDWTINIDLSHSTLLCEVDGLPGDLDICYG